MREAGFFHPVPIVRAWRPEYVLLVDRGNGLDHTTGLADALAERLIADGLAVYVYYFNIDPAVCFESTARGEKRHKLRQVVARHPHARCIGIGDAAGLFHPMTSEPLRELQTLTQWTGRAWMTTAPAPWGYREYQLAAEGFAVAPLEGLGLAEISGWFETASHAGMAPWYEPQTADPLPTVWQANPNAWLDDLALAQLAPTELAELDLSLHAFLGEKGVRLLHAAAVYPRVHAGLSLVLDERLHPDDAATVREQRLMRFSRLPWCRQGRIPEGLRLHWLRSLSPSQRETLRAAFESIFAARAEQPRQRSGSLAIKVPPKPSVRRLLGDLFRFSPSQSVFGDAIFASIVLGRRLSPLEFELPQRWGLPSPSMRWRLGSMALGAGLVAALGVWAASAVWSQWGDGWASNGLNAWQGQLLANERVLIFHPEGKLILARRLSAMLEAARLTSELVSQTPVAGASSPPSAAGRAFVGVGANPSWVARQALRVVPERLSWLLYGAPFADWNDPETARRVAQTRADIERALQVDLAESNWIWLPESPRRGAVFRDRLSPGLLPVPPVAPTVVLVPEMVAIPGGQFQMGSPDNERGRSSDEGPVRDVTIAPFYLSKYEVSFDEYDAFAKATGRKLPDDRGWGRGERPVIYVSWNDAQAYAAWLSEVTGQSFRLPSEAEWEYAARAGTNTRYWWGNEIRPGKEVMANCRECGSEWGGKQTAPRGQFPANGFGLHDTQGNVYEWVEDCWHGNYQGAPQDGRAWIEADKKKCSGRVVRGGSWDFDADFLRSAFRNWYGADVANDLVGFRLARAL